MGLASSQARLLNLTSRMHDIEYKAQKLEAQKLQMANESTQVYQEYENALNKTKVQFKQIGTDGSANFVDVTGKTLKEAGYAFEVAFGDNRGKVYHDIKSAAAAAGVELSDEALGGVRQITEITCNYIPTYNYHDGYATVTDIDEETTKNLNNATGKNYTDWKKVVMDAGDTFYCSYSVNSSLLYSNNMGVLQDCYEIATRTTTTVYETAGTSDTISNLLGNAFIILVKVNDIEFTDGDDIHSIINTNTGINIFESNIATDTSLQEVSDETLLKKAEAKYEADMRKINQKDKKFDTDLAAMDAERNAIKTEMDTLKSVAKENVDRTFKLFG